MTLHDAGLRILVPLDDALQSQRALAYAQTLAHTTHGTLRLVRATDLDDATSINSLAENAKSLQDAGAAVEWSVVSGVDGQTAIRDAAAEWPPDLIALATSKLSGFDRWLNGSVAEAVVKSASAPVLLVPRDWNRSPVARGSAKILIALDGSWSAERAVDVAIVLASRIPAELVVVRAIHAEHDRRGAEEYLRRTASRMQSVLDERTVTWRLVVENSAPTAILDAARDLDVDAILMTTRGRGSAHRLSVGSTTTAVVDEASAPLILIGPGAFMDVRTAHLKMGADVRTTETERVGEVHRIIVDFEQRAIVGIVVLGRGALARDVLVPIDVVSFAADSDVRLQLTRERFERLPDFTYNEFDTPPPTWTEQVAPAHERVRLGLAQHDVTAHTQVLGDAGAIGHVDQVDVDPETGRLIAFWVRAGGVRRQRMRIPAEWVRGADAHANVRVDSAGAEIARTS